MSIIIKRFVLLTVITIAFSVTVEAQNKLPEVTVTKLNGEKVNIGDFGKNGKITVLNFWATWCSPCKKELSNIQDMYGDWQEDYDMELLAISIDDSRSVARVKSYVSGQAWEYEVLLDVNQDLKRSLNFSTVPYTLLIDQEGNIVYKHQGYVDGDEYELEDKIKELKK